MYKRMLVAFALLASANCLFADEAPAAVARTIFGFKVPTLSLPKVTLPKLALPTMETVKTTAKSAVNTVGTFCKKQVQKGFNLVNANRLTSAKIAAGVLATGVAVGAVVKARNKWLDTEVQYRDWLPTHNCYIIHYLTRRAHKRAFGSYFSMQNTSANRIYNLADR